MTMQAGTYYIGDLCYVLGDRWDEFCDITIDGDDVLDGVFSLKDGTQFATYGTAHGDGTFRDPDGHEYSVDAGLIGCVRLDKIDPSKLDNLGLGRIFEFKYDFSTGEKNGVIWFGEITIDTGWDDDEEDDWSYEEEEEF